MKEIPNILCICQHVIRFRVKKIKVSIKDFFRKCDQICRKVRFWLRFMKKSIMKNSFSVQYLWPLALHNLLDFLQEQKVLQPNVLQSHAVYPWPSNSERVHLMN